MISKNTLQEKGSVGVDDRLALIDPLLFAISVFAVKRLSGCRPG